MRLGRGRPWRDTPPAAASLGALEAEVMDAIWAEARARTVRDVQAALGGRHAYTTLMTTLDRLFKKGLLERHKERRAFLYSPRVSRRELALGIGAGLLREMIAKDAEHVLSGLIDAVTERDRELLDTLERLVRDRRRALEGR